MLPALRGVTAAAAERRQRLAARWLPGSGVMGGHGRLQRRLRRGPGAAERRSRAMVFAGHQSSSPGTSRSSPGTGKFDKFATLLRTSPRRLLPTHPLCPSLAAPRRTCHGMDGRSVHEVVILRLQTDGHLFIHVFNANQSNHSLAHTATSSHHAHGSRTALMLMDSSSSTLMHAPARPHASSARRGSRPHAARSTCCWGAPRAERGAAPAARAARGVRARPAAGADDAWDEARASQRKRDEHV